MSLDPHSDAYYRRIDENTFMPTLHAQGAWQDAEQHMAPISALMTYMLEAHEPRDDMQIGRITWEILGMIPAAESHIEVVTLRPGRTIELLEATLTIGGRVIIRARAWRLSVQDTTARAGNELPAMDGPEHAAPMDPTKEWPGGYIASLEMRQLPGGRDGRRSVWIRTRPTLVEGERATPVAALVTRVDTANGVATRFRPTELMFPNVELSLHLIRTPRPGWVGLDTAVTFGPTGLGLTSTTVHDEDGPVGKIEQCLTVREFPDRSSAE
ncbi:thioesterase family protein [Yimella sp. RIT 621]|uniref:thioesterase family protein n=1 Tax=unclassified Yimella TaxID=2649892 RepID=UPI001EFC214C|nr:thioesterase family protein [Yimella sp. RIT 621]MCG8654224.1 thioesterase family protein [Yimella sp. NH-Cas1]